MRRLTSVEKVNAVGEVVATYRSASRAALENCISIANMHRYCNGTLKKKVASDGFLYRWGCGENP